MLGFQVVLFKKSKFNSSDLQHSSPESSNANENYYEKAYELYHDVWNETFQKLEGRNKVSSDNFSRQEEIVSVFYQEQCVALICFRTVKSTFTYVRRDSYFEAWPDEAFNKLSKFGSKMTVSSHITVHEKFRKTYRAPEIYFNDSKSDEGFSLDIDMKKIITYLGLKYVQSDDFDVVCGTVRADKGMEKVLYDCGAQPLYKNLIYHNVPVDLIALYPKRFPIVIPDSAFVQIEWLWMNRILVNANFAEEKIVNESSFQNPDRQVG